MNLPHEKSEKIQKILNSDVSLQEKSAMIYQYDKFLCDMHDRRAPKPAMNVKQIHIELKSRELLNNPETQRPITEEEIDEILKGW